jgi:hypothetical protein
VTGWTGIYRQVVAARLRNGSHGRSYHGVQPAD